MSDILFRLIKILDIGYIAIIYVLLGLLLAKTFDWLKAPPLKALLLAIFMLFIGKILFSGTG